MGKRCSVRTCVFELRDSAYILTTLQLIGLSVRLHVRIKFRRIFLRTLGLLLGFSKSAVIIALWLREGGFLKIRTKTNIEMMNAQTWTVLFPMLDNLSPHLIVGSRVWPARYSYVGARHPELVIVRRRWPRSAAPTPVRPCDANGKRPEDSLVGLFPRNGCRGDE